MAYRGSVAPIPLGHMGLMTDRPVGDLPPGSLLRANNISYETGMLTKAPGSLRYNTTVLPAGIVGLFDWWPNSVTQRLIAVCSNGAVYRDDGDKTFRGASAILTGLSNMTPRCVLVEGGSETASRSKKLFLFSDDNQVKVLEADGVTMSTIDSPAADWTAPNYPGVGVIHRNRLWAFMGQRAYASDTANHENFTSNILTQNIFPGEGGKIIGCFVFKGRLFSFKEGGYVYYLDDGDSDSDNWVWRKLASNFGLSSPHGIVEIVNDMIAVNESGSPTSYSAVDSLGDIESADVLRLMEIEGYFRSVTSFSGLDVMHAIYYAAKKQAFFTFRTGYRTTNDTLFHIDFNRQNPRAAFWNKDQADCLAMRKDIMKILRPIYGSSDGYVYLMDREDRLVGGSAYTGEFRTAHTDFRYLDQSIAHKNKLYDFLDIEFLPNGAWNVEVDVYIDGSFSETINYAMDVRDDGLGTFTLDTDLLGREETQTIRKPLHGSGRQISFTVRQAGTNQNFTIASMKVSFRLADEKASKA